MTQLPELNEKIKYLTGKIEKNPENADYYSQRGLCYFSSIALRDDETFTDLRKSGC